MAEPNWQSKTIFTGDNLPIMRGMNSDSVDLIYLDPPFNSNADYAAPIGSKAAGAAFKDTWSLADVDLAWLDLIEAKELRLHRVLQAAMTRSDQSYLIYMAIRILEMKRILKDTGSIYLHCDPLMSHYLKLVMDAIFDKRNYRSEIVWTRRFGRSKGSQHLPKKWGVHNDILYFYAGSEGVSLKPFEPIKDQEQLSKRFPKIEDGKRYTTMAHFRGKGMGDRPNLRYEWRGFANPHPSGWRLSKERLESEYQAGTVVIRDDGRLERRRYYDEKKGIRIGNLWSDIAPVSDKDPESTGYPTQKPLALLKRIINASSEKEAVIFDPFCGCATTLVAAEDSFRRWVGIDISPRPVDLVTGRIKENQGIFKDIIARQDIPKRTDLGDLPRYSSAENKKHLFGKQEGKCNGCLEEFPIKQFEVGHIVAKAKGGTAHIDNLQLLCRPCNSTKGDRGQEYFVARLKDRYRTRYS